MKDNIHPKYKKIKFICACGAVFEAGSTIEDDFKTELCSACHPFFTGKQKLVDSSGRVDKFYSKVKKAQEQAEKRKKTGKTTSRKIVFKKTSKKIKNESEGEAETETAKEE